MKRFKFNAILPFIDDRAFSGFFEKAIRYFVLIIFFYLCFINLSLAKAAEPKNGILYDTILYASHKYSIPLPFLIAVMKAESAFNISAKSRKGAVGLMQLLPRTAASFGMNADNPESNIVAGALYLRYCMNMFGNRPVPALACYNAGPGSVRIIKRKNGAYEYLIPDFPETISYILNVHKYYEYYKKILRGHGG